MRSVDSSVSKWLQDQMTPGVSADSTTMYFSEEVKRIVNDSKFRDSLYKQPYTFFDVGKSLGISNYRFAFWQMINLYPQNKQQVLRYVVAYDKLISADKLLASSFYTYALLDPRITVLTDGKPKIVRPDIMDSMFHNMNEIINYIVEYRKANSTR